jgi:hypothetical protein
VHVVQVYHHMFVVNRRHVVAVLMGLLDRMKTTNCLYRLDDLDTVQPLRLSDAFHSGAYAIIRHNNNVNTLWNPLYTSQPTVTHNRNRRQSMPIVTQLPSIKQREMWESTLVQGIIVLVFVDLLFLFRGCVPFVLFFIFIDLL